MNEITIPVNTKGLLTQTEAGRLITELQRRYGLRVKYREAQNYSPAEIAADLKKKQINLSAEDVAKFAGR